MRDTLPVHFHIFLQRPRTLLLQTIRFLLAYILVLPLTLPGMIVGTCSVSADLIATNVPRIPLQYTRCCRKTHRRLRLAQERSQSAWYLCSLLSGASITSCVLNRYLVLKRSLQ